MSKWTFNEQKPGDKAREPMQGEFFATDTIRNHAEALVREGIQNSLDAAIKSETGIPTKPIRVRIFLGEGPDSKSPDEIRDFFTGSWPHFLAEGNGLQNRPTETERCRYLVIEDFGTSGLTGDTAQWHDIPGNKNPFYYFFRAEGRTGKSDDDRGRWGIGKFVFPRSSRARAFFGLTVRYDDQKRLLMGQAVLKTHACNGHHYMPDGSYGNLDRNLPLPISDTETIDSFCKTFSVSRNNESGLSIIIPWLEEGITYQTLVEAVIRGYFWPLLDGSLVVQIQTGNTSLEINDKTLKSTLDKVSAEVKNEMLPLIDLAEWATSMPDSSRLDFPTPPDTPTWSGVTPSEGLMSTLQKKLDAGERVGLRIPIWVRPKNTTPTLSFFDIFLANDGNDRRTEFIREGITISDVRSKVLRGICSIISIQDKPLAALLGDSENPAHTQWQKDSSNFCEKYPKTYGASAIRFVTHSVSNILGLLGEQKKEEDKAILRDFFSIPIPPQTDSPPARERHPGNRGGDKPSVLPPMPEPRKKRYRMTKIEGGFRVSAGESDEIPQILDIRLAYDIRRGNPFKKYSQADFTMDSPSFEIEFNGMNIVSRNENRILAEVGNRNFSLAVTGFDSNRDLCVDVKAKERENAPEV